MSLNFRKNRAPAIATLLSVAVVLMLLASIALVSLTYHHLVLDGRWALSSEWLRSVNAETRAAALGQLGDYFGGTLNPILSFSGFLVLLITVVLQRRQLEEGTRQFEQSTRAIDLEAFVRVDGILQTPVGIAARERLYELFDDAAQRLPLAQWTPADRKAAESVCRQLELVGLLVQGKLFDPELFLRSWRRTVVRCWGACEELVAERRQRSGDPGLWRHFEALSARAQAGETSDSPDPKPR